MRRRKFLKAASLVSTVLVNRCQHHLLSAISFSHRQSVEEWCSIIGAGPHGVSRHVRALNLINERVCSPLVADVLETAISHLTSFRNLQRLEVLGVDLSLTPLNVFISIISSFSGTLKRLLWIQVHDTDHKTWTTVSTIVNLLPNLVDLFLSGSFFRADCRTTYSPLPRIQLPDDMELEHIDSLAFNHFKFQELRIGSLVPNSLSFLEYCQMHLRALDLRDLRICDRELTLIGSGL